MGPCRVTSRLKFSAQRRTMDLTKLEKPCQVRCIKHHPAEGGTGSVLCLVYALSALTSYPLICQCMQETKSKTTAYLLKTRKKLTEQTQAAPRQAHVMGCAKLKRSPHSGLEAAGHFP